MYYILDNHKKLKQLEKPVITHKQDIIYDDNLAKSVKEIENAKEFIELDR